MLVVAAMASSSAATLPPLTYSEVLMRTSSAVPQPNACIPAEANGDDGSAMVASSGDTVALHGDTVAAPGDTVAAPGDAVAAPGDATQARLALV